MRKMLACPFYVMGKTIQISGLVISFGIRLVANVFGATHNLIIGNSDEYVEF